MVLGTYKDIVTARATDKQIQNVSQDGGIVTALFTYALNEGIIEGAVVAGNTDTPWQPEPTIAMSADEIIAAAGTKYTFSPNNAVLKEAVRQCGIEIMGLRKMQSYPFSTRFLADKIKLLIGIFCMENFSYASLQTFVESKLNGSMELTDKMDIGKGKLWIEDPKGNTGLKLKETHGYEQAGCNICKDYVAELADVSTGSVGSPDGWSTVLTRTDAGKTIFDAAVEAGVIETKAVDEGKFGKQMLEKLAGQKKDKAAKESKSRMELGLPVPW